MKKWVVQNKLYVIGAIVGALSGFFYWKYVGWLTGTCAITSNPLRSTFYFALMGSVAFGMFKNRTKRKRHHQTNNRMKKFIAIITIMAAFTTVKASAQNNAIHKVVMQLASSDTSEHRGLMMNLKNIKEGWGDSVVVEVVVHGPGIDLVTKGKSTQASTIQDMVKRGIQFVVCRNTMKQKNISEDQIIPNVGIVPMAIGEIVMKQEQGWSYLKAGY